jgi:thiamine-phosphate pyrophosphorylase
MICLVTDRRRLSAGADAMDLLVELVGAASRAGIDLVQVRERDLEGRALAALVGRCLAAVDRSATKVLVNDRVDIAAATGAHGVHLRADSVSVAAARLLLGEHAVVGRSIHTVDEAAAAAANGADYLIFGALYQTMSKDAGHPTATLDDLRSAQRAASGVPILPIGGITAARAAEMARAGAAGIAGIGIFVPPPGVSADRHLQGVAAQLRRSFDTCEPFPYIDRPPPPGLRREPPKRFARRRA